MIPVEPFNNPVSGSREFNAVKKAVKEKPEVTAADVPKFELWSWYRVGDKYNVGVYIDPDGQYFIECECLAGSPPIDEATGLPSREASPCYHAAAVLIHIAEEKENNVES